MQLNYSVSFDHHGVNGGFVIFRPDCINKNSYNQILHICEEYKSHIKSPCEFIFSTWFGDKMELLPRYYNQVSFTGSVNSILQKGFNDIPIKHFMGTLKPWNEEHPEFNNWLNDQQN